MTVAELNADGLLVDAADSIFTYTGGWVRPLDPDPATLKIEDIAHALAQQCRWTGHTVRPYSVAEHSINVSRFVPEEERLDALLHDGSEAYLTDLARPIKKAAGLGPVYLEFEEKLERAIATRFGVRPLGELPNVKQADEWVLWAEAKILLPGLGPMMPDPPPKVLDVIVGMPAAHAERLFLQKFGEYGGVA